MSPLLIGAILAATPTPAQLLTQAHAHYEALEFETVLAAADAVLSHKDSTSDQRMDAYMLLGCALVAFGDAIEAEKPFRFLLRGRPEYELPPDTSPKIVAVFRKVQAEDREARAAIAAVTRTRLIDSVRLLDPLPTEATGGLPFVLNAGIFDPSGAVAGVELRYRKDRSADFSALALQRDATGRWSGSLPAEWTENDNGADVDLYLATLDATGEPLRLVHTAESPGVLRLTPGTVGDHAPFYRKPWFWIVTGAVTVAAAGGGWLAWDRSRPTDSTGGIWRPE